MQGNERLAHRAANRPGACREAKLRRLHLTLRLGSPEAAFSGEFDGKIERVTEYPGRDAGERVLVVSWGKVDAGIRKRRSRAHAGGRFSKLSARKIEVGIEV